MPSVVMQSLFSLLPLWLAATAVGLPLQDSPEDIWRSELGCGISGPRGQCEVVPELRLHDHRPATDIKVASRHSQSRLLKRDIIQDVRDMIGDGHRRLRNFLWSDSSIKRCLRRKRRKFDEIKNDRLDYENWEQPGPDTVAEWGKICSAWETANADTKVGYIGETIKEEKRRKDLEEYENRPRWTEYFPDGEGVAELLSDKLVRDFDFKKVYERPNPNDYNIERGPPDTWNFADVGPDLAKQAWKYVGPGEGRADMPSPGRGPKLGGKVMRPIRP